MDGSGTDGLVDVEMDSSVTSGLVSMRVGLGLFTDCAVCYYLSMVSEAGK